MERKNTTVALLIGLALILTLCACSASVGTQPDGEPSNAQLPAASSSTGEGDNAEQPPSDVPEDNFPEMIPVALTVGGQTFSVSLEDNETTRAFSALLPLTLEMSELNGNEKYFIWTPRFQRIRRTRDRSTQAI